MLDNKITIGVGGTHGGGFSVRGDDGTVELTWDNDHDEVRYDFHSSYYGNVMSITHSELLKVLAIAVEGDEINIHAIPEKVQEILNQE